VAGAWRTSLGSSKVQLMGFSASWHAVFARGKSAIFVRPVYQQAHLPRWYELPLRFEPAVLGTAPSELTAPIGAQRPRERTSSPGAHGRRTKTSRRPPPFAGLTRTATSVSCAPGGGRQAALRVGGGVAQSVLRPPERHRPDIPPRFCRQRSLTVPPKVNDKTRQKHSYPSQVHRRSYARRTAAERAHARLAESPRFARLPHGVERHRRAGAVNARDRSKIVTRRAGPEDVSDARLIE
jgi:hypothetical protein